jgi:hypothetical protein
MSSYLGYQSCETSYRLELPEDFSERNQTLKAQFSETETLVGNIHLLDRNMKRYVA